MKPVINKDTIRTHFQYSWWKYLILVTAAIMGWNLLYNSTRYQPPEEKKIEVYYQGSLSSEGEETITAWLEETRLRLAPELEEVSVLGGVGTDETYGVMQLTVWMAAGQGDIYILEKDQYKSLADAGSFVNLQPYIDSGVLNVDGLKLYNCKTESGESYPCGIYTDELTGMDEMGFVSSGRMMGVLTSGGNTDNAILFMNALVEHTRGSTTAESTESAD